MATVAPVERAMTRHELRSVGVQLAATLGAPVELAFTDGSEIVGRQQKP
jgi:hypothetical protein